MSSSDHRSRMVVRAHAKVNLSLQVTGVRSDGYHLLKTVFQTLALHDLLTFERTEGPFVVTCSDPAVPTDERNLVRKAADLVWRSAGREGEPRGIRVEIAKRIPAQGGLGGGSSDGAAALVALDALWQARLAPTLPELAGRLGADVPFFLAGGTALGLGRGDEIHPLGDLEHYAAVLVFPPFGVSTPEAFRWFDLDAVQTAEGGGSPGPGAETSGAAYGCVSVPGAGVIPIVNDLQAPVSRRHPEIGRACGSLRDQGADAAAMSGSGSTVFGLFADASRAASAAAVLGRQGWRTLVTATASRDESGPPGGRGD